MLDDDRPETEGSGPWNELTDDLVRLTDKLRATYSEVANGDGPSEDEIRDALRTLAAAWSQLAGSIGVALQDEEVRAYARRAGSSLVTAVTASLSELASHEEEP